MKGYFNIYRTGKVSVILSHVNSAAPEQLCKNRVTNNSSERTSVIPTSVMQDTPGNCLSIVWEDGKWLRLWLSLEGHLANGEPGERTVDSMWRADQSRREGRRPNEVCKGRTQDAIAGILCWVVAWREGAGDLLTVMCASSRIWNLIQAATGSWMHTLALLVHVS